jgi:predicted house-cleaning noncanonical NTP pyrophosphatase (MazG superfamily)
MSRYNKLVRDKIPEIIKNSGEAPIVKCLDEEEYKEELDKKLLEEVYEYLESDDSAEIADILEVIYAILDYKKIDKNQMETIRETKKDKRGAFSERIFLIDVETKENYQD